MEKAATMKRFEYSTLDSELKKQTGIEKDQYKYFKVQTNVKNNDREDSIKTEDGEIIDNVQQSRRCAPEIFSGPNLDKNSIQFSDPALFYENYTKFYFDPKHEKTGLNRGGKSCSALFIKISALCSQCQTLP